MTHEHSAAHDSPLHPAVDRLRLAVEGWLTLGCPGREALLRACMPRLENAADAWIAALPDQPPGELWLGDLWPVQHALARLADAMAEEGRPPLPQVRREESACGGTFCMDVLPAGWMDRVLLPGLRCAVRPRPQRQPTQGRIYRARLAGESPRGGVAVVWGGGVQASEAVLDALHRLVAADELPLLVLPPTQRALLQVLSHALAPLVQHGVLGLACADTEEVLAASRALGVRSMHRAGGPWPAERPAPLRVSWSARVPGPSPVVLAPGPWSEADVELCARTLARQAAWGGGRCPAGPGQLFLAQGWAPGEALVARLEALLGEATRGPRSLRRAEAGEGLALTRAQVPHAIALLDVVAARWPEGGPCAEVWLHPQTESEGGAPLAQALQRLPFAAVGLNVWPGLIYALGLGWGAGSEAGLAHSVQLVDHPARVLLRAPFSRRRLPVWAQSDEAQVRLGQALVRAERLGWSGLPQVALAALGR